MSRNNLHMGGLHRTYDDSDESASSIKTGVLLMGWIT